MNASNSAWHVLSEDDIRRSVWRAALSDELLPGVRNTDKIPVLFQIVRYCDCFALYLIAAPSKHLRRGSAGRQTKSIMPMHARPFSYQ